MCTHVVEQYVVLPLCDTIHYCLLSSTGLVQQHRVERGTFDMETVRAVGRALRVQQAAAVQVASSHGATVVEPRTQRPCHRPETVRPRQDLSVSFTTTQSCRHRLRPLSRQRGEVLRTRRERGCTLLQQL